MVSSYSLLKFIYPLLTRIKYFMCLACIKQSGNKLRKLNLSGVITNEMNYLRKGKDSHFYSRLLYDYLMYQWSRLGLYRIPILSVLWLCKLMYDELVLLI